MPAELLVLRLVHIIGGLFWIGSALFTTIYLAPALAAAGPAAGAIMASMQRRRLFIVLPSVALLTMLSGLRLLWITSGGFDATYLSTGSGLVYTLSGAASIVAFLLSLLIARPAALRGGELAASLAANPEGTSRDALVAELARVRRRGGITSAAAMWLLLLAAAGMAVARYV